MNHARYWIDEAAESLKTAEVLWNGHRYLESGFFAHLTVEKALKAFYVERRGGIPPKTHNLIVLAQQSGIDAELTTEQLEIIADLAPLNIESRYPQDREKIFKSTTPDGFMKYIENAREILEWIISRLSTRNG